MNVLTIYLRPSGDANQTGQVQISTNGSVVATTFIGDLQGNATTATTLQTSRNFTINGSTKAFDGSADATWTLDEIGVYDKSHIDGLNSKFLEYTMANGYNGMIVNGATDVWLRTTRNGLIPYDNSGTTSSLGTATWQFSNIYGRNIFEGGTALVDKYLGKTDNAVSSSKLLTPRNIKIGNTTKQLDGTQDIEWTLAEIGAVGSNHTHTSNHISAMTGYNKGATTPADVLDTDSLNIAIAKLENKIDNKTGAYKLTRLSNSITLVGNANSVTIGVAFDSSKDILNVYLSGVRLTPDVDYTATNTTITGIGGTTFISGDVVSFEVIKIEVI